MQSFVIEHSKHLAIADLQGLQLPLVLERIYAARQIQSSHELDYALHHLLHFQSLKDIHVAAHLLCHAIIQQKKILIVGDFDTDGASSTALAVLALKSFGAQYVQYIVPNRFKYGYGLTPEILEGIEIPDLIMTVDNGISSHQGVLYAQQGGAKVLITDHHLPPETLPKAQAIVNPQQAGDHFLSKNLAGVGVAFYVMLATRALLKKSSWFDDQNITYPAMNSFLDLVALGTTADMVPFDRNNRILVYQGLKKIRASQTRAGIKALARLSNFNLEKSTASDLSFFIAPRLNAAGRLQDMSLGIECLLTHDMQKAVELAQHLEELNQERKIIEQTMQKEAFYLLSKLNVADNSTGICLFDPSWHQGITGLLAGRIKEKWKKPTVVFAPGNHAEELKGSARSITGIHIRDVLADIAIKNPLLLSRFGGHAAAAGLTLEKKHYPTFKKRFEENIQQQLKKLPSQNTIKTDGSLTAKELTLSLAMLIASAGPWGQGFEEPLFDNHFEVISQTIVGRKHLKLLLKLPGTEHYFKGIFFNVDLEQWPNSRVRSVHAVYHLLVNEWLGKKELQLKIKNLMCL